MSVRVLDVWKEYVMGTTSTLALRGVTLEVRAGEFVAITGPSGSGKSTLTYLISALDVPTKGKVEVDGTVVSELNEGQRSAWRRRNVGMIFQFFHLLPTLTALENVMFSMELAGIRGDLRSRALEFLDFVGLREKANRFPFELSGGEQQRVAIARAISMDPKIVVADEPTAFLDRENKLKVMELLRKVNERGKTVIFTTHDLELAAFAERRVRLVDGQVAGEERSGRAR
ncbi:MAG: ABC transporter ATP-binding protein [Acidilobaceae archaeon]|nr:ABC transporter ATP-binding protein [Acidilobaceae archaeon]MCX8165352.1 ABC transporter ATP-binding protein [Acidilobaceae archaeon]MDW7973777.1 ABC transporter ATP-binding protein [Sulfolobales archaeon]